MKIVTIGETTRLAGYALAGVEVVEAAGDASVERAWDALGSDVGLVLLTPEARRALPDPIEDRRRLWVVLPA